MYTSMTFLMISSMVTALTVRMEKSFQASGTHVERCRFYINEERKRPQSADSAGSGKECEGNSDNGIAWADSRGHQGKQERV